MKKLFYLLMLCYLSICGNELKGQNLLHDFRTKKNMKVTKIPFDTEDIKRPLYMEYSDGFLYFNEYNADYFVDIFNCSTGKLEKSVLKKGSGPNEFLYISNMTKDGKNMCLYDGQLKKITYIPLMGNETSKNPKNITIENNSTIIRCFKVFPLNNEKYLVSGIITDAHWAIVDSSGHMISAFGTYPNNHNRTKPSDADLAMAYQPSFISNPAKTKGLYTYSRGIILRFCDISTTGHLTKTKEYFYENIDFTPESNERRYSVSFSKDNTWSFIDIKGSEKYCFLLYSGLRLSEIKNGENSFSGNRILIFDWDGNPVQEILLPHRFMYFAVNDDDRLLYLLKENTEEFAEDDYSIYKLDLSSDFESF